ncbi:uncharacterized protein LOC116304280 [Actinia tenebrosa]|uniref:Uncharacterized protein LOC116304280 n=1 Tax=Actinia tenebrosa TaxID=6105 RepID=A0A6P8IUL5_ACTTE|nr:uncharacterized protein LOC116304280 [Actinia tenebrosa]
MPLLLEYCGLNLRSATIVIGCFALFYSGYHVIKYSTMIAVLNGIENDDTDLPRHDIPNLLKVLYMGISVAGAMIICSMLLLFGVWKKLPSLIFMWIPASVVYLLLDLAVIIYCVVTYTDLSSIALYIGISCFWYALHIYFIMVVALYLKYLTGRLLPGAGYHSLTSDA